MNTYKHKYTHTYMHTHTYMYIHKYTLFSKMSSHTLIYAMIKTTFYRAGTAKIWRR